MRNNITVILILIGVSGVLAPFCAISQYADTVHETDFQNEFTFCYNYDGEYLTSISELRDSNLTQNGWSYLEFKQYDSDFNIIRSTQYTDSTHFIGGYRSLVLLGDAYYFSGRKDHYPVADTVTGYIAKYDTVGNLLWLRDYFTNHEWVWVEDIVPISSNELVVSGSKYLSLQGNSEAFLMKVDTSGDTLWTKTFETNNPTALALRPTSDGGFLYSMLINAPSTDAWILKLDSNGDIDWQKVVNSSSEGTVLKAEEMPSGEILCSGISYHPLTSVARPYIVKLNAAGNIVSDSIYELTSGYNSFSTVGSPIYEQDGLYLLGTSYSSISSDTNQAVLNYLDYNLNLKWQRKYSHREAENSLTQIFQDPGYYGHYVMTGCVFQDPSNQTNDEWFLRVDSLGCESSICAASMAIENQNEFKPLIYPNPVSDRLNIVNAINVECIKIYSNKGELLLIDFNKNKININNLDSGVYICVVESDENQAIAKFIIQR